MTLTIPRSPEVEQTFRKAAEQVNRRLESYRLAMPNASKEQLMSYVALEIANDLQKLQANEQKLDLHNRLQKLNRDLEESM